MYARITTFTVDPDRLGELQARILELRRLVKALPGMVDAHVGWRSDGHGVVIAVYESRERADAAMKRLQVIFGTLASLLTGPPRTDAYEFVEHITH